MDQLHPLLQPTLSDHELIDRLNNPDVMHYSHSAIVAMLSLSVQCSHSAIDSSSLLQSVSNGSSDQSSDRVVEWSNTQVIECLNDQMIKWLNDWTVEQSDDRMIARSIILQQSIRAFYSRASSYNWASFYSRASSYCRASYSRASSYSKSSYSKSSYRRACSDDQMTEWSNDRLIE